MSIHGIINQKNNVIFRAMKASNLSPITCKKYFYLNIYNKKPINSILVYSVCLKCITHYLE
jgi:hypothetical protein